MRERLLTEFTEKIIQALEKQCQADDVETLDLSTVCDVVSETLRKEL